MAQSKDVALNPDHAVEIYYSAEILQWRALSRFLFSPYEWYVFK